MMKDKFPVSQAIRFLRSNKIEFTSHLYEYEEQGGTEVAARELGIDEHATIKTIVMVDALSKPLLVLMHGDYEVSTQALARHLGTKRVTPCTPKDVTKHTGYLVGGTSPFGIRVPLPVYFQETMITLDRLYINGGKRGFLVGVTPADVLKVLNPTIVDVAAT